MNTNKTTDLRLCYRLYGQEEVQMKAKIVFVAIVTLFSLCNIISVEPQEEVVQEQKTTTEQPTAIVEEVVLETVAEPTYKLCDIPLSQELQIWVFDYCKDKKLNPYMIMAMCERESQYNANAVGDSGRSLGIMQIQPRWYEWRMDKLGCTDLMDARQNMMVGIDILIDLYIKCNDTAWVLMAYNGGEAYANRNYNAGNISEYARYIMTRTEEMESDEE